MALRITNTKFKERARLIHGDLYDYSKVDYKKHREGVLIICKLHGEFSQRVDTHLRGSICKKCAIIKQAAKQTLNIKEFVKKAKEVHKGNYDYSKTQYADSRERIKIICKKHGEFLQVASKHLRGKGCSECGKEKSTNSRTYTKAVFIEKAKKTHGNTYDYSKVRYSGHDTKVKILCHIHGCFRQTPCSHLNQKSGCPICGRNSAGYRKSDFVGRCKNSKAILYLIQVYGNNEKFYKLGITSNSIKRRYSAVGDFPYSYKIVIESINLPASTWDLEKHLLKSYRQYKYVPKTRFKGYTECFNVKLPLTEIKDIISKCVLK